MGAALHSNNVSPCIVNTVTLQPRVPCDIEPLAQDHLLQESDKRTPCPLAEPLSSRIIPSRT